MVADRHPVGVPGQVLQHLFRAAERRLGVDDPFGLGAGSEPALELARVGQRGELPMEGELALIEGGFDQGEELPPEDAAEDADRQEEAGFARDPARAVGRQPAARHDAVDVRVMLQVLAPGVEDGQEADLGPEVLRVGGDLLQGLGGGFEQEAVDLPRVLQRDRAERRRERKDDVMILDRQQFRLPGLHPLRGGGGLALGAVAVAARVVGDLLMAAVIAFLDVSAQGGSPAGGDVAQGATLLRRERVAVAVEEGITIVADDLGHFEPRSGHGRDSPGKGSSRSRGLRVAWTAAGETWV